MIVILCDSFKDAVYFFYIFLNYLKASEPWSILNIYEKCLCVETDEDLRYIFIDRLFVNAFKELRPDVVEVTDFFVYTLRGEYDLSPFFFDYDFGS